MQGGDSWFFITVDYAFGHALEENATEFVAAASARPIAGVLDQSYSPVRT